MKVLIVCSGNAENFDFKIHQAFVYEQIETIKKLFVIDYQTFFIKGKGFTGYLKNLQALKKKIHSYSPDIIHAHFGLSGLLACLQREAPVVITFHGSDADKTILMLSKSAARLSVHNIFVSDKIKDRIKGSKRFSIIPCGINLKTFFPVDMNYARQQLSMNKDKKYVLFASGFDNPVKNSSLAFSALKLLNGSYELIELKNKNREEVNLLLNACNLLLLTSHSEGSPQIIKEAMACNCPIVATDVGDIREVTAGTEGCYITSNYPEDVADKIRFAFEFNRKTNGRDKILLFDNNIIAKQIYSIYQMILSNQESDKL